MRCKQCDYPLWNLRSRQCPECGHPFKPSEFEFVLNSVRFCCPHCNQDYYGTGEGGHLSPAEFDCVSCGHHIHMDEMILLPTEGVREEQTATDTMPWLDPRTGRIKGFFATAFRGLFEPLRLARSMPAEPAAGRAFLFAFLCTTFPPLFGAGLAMLFPLMMAFATPGGAGGAFLGGMIMALLMFLVALVVIMLILLAVWILTAHAILRLTGPVRGTVGRTAEPLCYGAAGNFVAAVPCVGPYIAWAGWIWWSISSILMLRQRQEVSGGRASAAVLALPVLLALVLGLYIALVIVPMTQRGVAGARAAVVQQQQTAAARVQAPQVAAALSAYRARKGEWPEHSIQLVAAGDLFAQNLILPGSSRTIQDIPIGPMSLHDFTLLPQEREKMLVDSAVASMPPDTLAHRLGDYIFTYHGAPVDNPDPGLWIAVAHASGEDLEDLPDADPKIIVIHADDTITTVPASQFEAVLARQNQLRQSLQIPPLPDPREVEDNKPATAGSP